MPQVSQFYTIEIQPNGKRIEIYKNDPILKGIRQAGIDLAVICGGKGTCGSCLIKIIKGKIAPATPEETRKILGRQLKRGYRLACQAIPKSDCVVEIPVQSLATSQRVQWEAEEIKVALHPSVKVIDFNLGVSTSNDLTSNLKRLLWHAEVSLGLKMQISNEAEKGIGTNLKKMGWKGKLVYRESKGRGSITAALPEGSKIIGLAVDIGTTKLAMYLVDLEKGNTIGQVGDLNPQISFGEDVISRVDYCNKNPDGRVQLRKILVDKLNEMILKTCESVGVEFQQIVDAVFVGNTAMHHLLCGFPVEQLGTSPYIPFVTETVILFPADMGLKINPGARIFLPPVVAGFVGSDHISMLLATDAWKAKKTTLALDIGTNTEIALIHKGKIVCCSCASGPAFEGAHISSGMRATKGAIERVQFENGRFDFMTIENKHPIGICGSGILDSIAAMKKAGIVDRKGILLGNHSRVGMEGFLLVPACQSETGKPIFVTRGDVHQVQLAKAAIRSGWLTLISYMKIRERDIKEVILAGAFGTYLQVESAKAIGMIPNLPVDSYQQVGNSRMRNLIPEVVGKMKHLELNNQPDFMDRYIHSLYLE
jgi:uncharacterized 2Fe-2S/4Fe-4S cluster protein (DUF4445 family)